MTDYHRGSKMYLPLSILIGPRYTTRYIRRPELEAGQRKKNGKRGKRKNER